MKLAWLTLAISLAAGMARTHGSSLSAELDSISPRSNIEAIGDFYRGTAAATAFLAAGVSSLSQTSVVNAKRSMWGQ